MNILLRIFLVMLLWIPFMAYGDGLVGPRYAVFYKHAGLSVTALGLDYVEKDENPDSVINSLDSEKGVIPGIRIALSDRINRLILSTQLSLNRGKASYDGFLQSSDSDGLVPFEGRSTQTILEWEAHAGWLFKRSETLWQPYLEVGWRRWHRGTLPPSFAAGVGFNGYTEVYAHTQILAGLQVDRAFDRTPVVASLAVALGTTVNPHMASDSPVFGIQNVATVTDTFPLSTRLMGYLKVGIAYRIDPNTNAHISLRYRQFGYGSSAVNVVGILEPTSITREFMASMGMDFGLL